MAALATASVAAVAPGAASAQAPAAFTETAAAPPAASTDDTEWTAQLGGTLNMGNTRSFQLAGGTHFLVRRDIHLFQMDLAFTYGLAAVRDANGVWGDFNANAQNITGKLRYDLFFDPDWSLFAVASGRNDPFAGLDFRFQGQLGVSRNLLREAEGVGREVGERTRKRYEPHPAHVGWAVADIQRYIGPQRCRLGLQDAVFDTSLGRRLGSKRTISSQYALV
jgi:hypothetical protein